MSYVNGSLWNDRENKLFEVLRPACSSEEIHQIFSLLTYNRSKDAIGRKGRRTGIEFTGAPLVTEDLNTAEIAAIEEVLGLEEVPEEQGDRKVVAPKDLPRASEKAYQTLTLRESTEKLLSELKVIRAEVPRQPSKPSTNLLAEYSLIALISDLHFGKQTYSLETGEQLFSLVEAQRRMDSLCGSILQEIESRNTECGEVVLALAGDLIEGENIYPNQSYNLETYAANQTKLITKIIWQMVLTLRSQGIPVRIETCYGNHGRTLKGAVKSNWDNIVYQQLELLSDLSDDEGLTIFNRYEEWTTFKVQGWKCMMRHWMPREPGPSPASAKLGGWHCQHGFDFAMYGHWHHWGAMTWQDKPIFRNGSLPGSDDYAESLGLSDGPCQLLIGVSEEQLPMFITPVKFTTSEKRS